MRRARRGRSGGGEPPCLVTAGGNGGGEGPDPPARRASPQPLCPVAAVERRLSGGAWFVSLAPALCGHAPPDSPVQLGLGKLVRPGP